MPFVPNVPGVPALTSYASESFTLLAADVISAALNFLFGPIYGIFLFGLPVIAADNYVRFEHKQDFSISTYPVEEGSFFSYDKVRLPAEIRVRVSTGGTIFDRQAFLRSIDAVMNDTNLYDVVTPEAIYLGYNFIRRDVVREADAGAGLIAVDLVLMEVLETATATFQSTQVPSVAGQQASGSVAPTSAAGIKFPSGSLG